MPSCCAQIFWSGWSTKNRGEKKKKKKKKHEIEVGCDGLFLSNSSTHWVRSSRPAAPHLAKDKANRGGRRCEGWRWMGPLQGSLAHAGCDVCVCKCVRVPLRSWAQRVEGGGQSANITEAYLKLGILCVWLVFFCCVWGGGRIGVCKPRLKSWDHPKLRLLCQA